MGHRTFAEMLEAIKQHSEGLVSDAELIMVLQCDTFQITALRQYNALPPNVADKCSIVDFDQSVQDARDRNEDFAKRPDSEDAGSRPYEQWPLDEEDDDNHAPLPTGGAA